MPLHIQLLNNGEPFALAAGAIVEINFEPPGGLHFPRLGTIQGHEQGQILYEIGPADIAIAGQMRANITVIDGEQRLTWQSFEFTVSRNLSDNQVEPPEALRPWQSEIEERLSDHEGRIAALESGAPADLSGMEARLSEALSTISALQAEATAKWVLLNDVDNRVRALENRVAALE